MLRVLNNAFDHPLNFEEQAATPFAGGIMQHGFQCGMIWGATLAAGAQAYRLYGSDPQAETKAITAAQKLVKVFRDDKNAINCSDITEIDKSSTAMQMITYFLIKGGTISCMRLASRYAPRALDEINSALSENSEETSSYPVSCSAILAQKMGVSDMHTVMAAGLAGGIGLCGGACGALGTAIWIMEIKKNQEGKGKIDFNDPNALELIEKFLQCTDYEFECSNCRA